MKLYISSDMEGTAGIIDWDETELNKPAVYSHYSHFAEQMTKEVAGACNGAVDGGIDEILVKDAHDYARNINPEMLPECAKIFRGWGRDQFSMMSGIDETFSAAAFTGYHSAASMNTNPLSHTMNTRNNYVKCNDMLMPEAMINALTAAYFGVPVIFMSGDRGVCEYMKQFIPEMEIAPVSEGKGAGSISVQPAKAVKMIQSGMTAAVKKLKKAQKDPELMKKLTFPMPEHFHIEINFKDHMKASWCSCYPGITQISTTAITYDADDYMDVLVMLHFLL